MTIAVGAVSGLALSACSSSGSTGSGGSGGNNSGGKTPTEALAAAVHNISSGKGEAFQLSLKPDDAMIAAMNKDSSKQDATIAKALFGNGGIVVKFALSSDKPLKDLKPGETPNVEFVANAGGTEYLDVRSVAGAVYLKANVPQIAQLGGKSVGDLNSQLGQIPPDFQAPVQAVLAGKWVGVSAADLKGLEQMASSLGGGDLSSTTAPGTNPALLSGMEASLLKALTQDATVSDKGGGQLEVTGKVKVIGQDILQAVGPALNAVPGQSKADLDKARESLNSIPDSETVTFEVWLKSNQINELQIDLAQFMPKTESGGGKLPLDMKFSQDAGKVSAPDGVTNIDVKKLIGALGSHS
ncbi:MAG: hypothetical protein AUG49_04105 [Catenulispora sp. 13_1_20CM_3_70_7]|nr:hypothetical protein [Catenulisporales bacterium]OLE27837.1 MAG: hypothetical protein AUG49_04105 [Catenulispora sp. 13_1_20CM_3_70_7]